MLETIRTTWKFLSRRQRFKYVALMVAQGGTNLLDLVGIAAIGLLTMAVATGAIDFDFRGLYRVSVDTTTPSLVVALVMFAAFSFLAKALFNLLLSLALIRYMAVIEVEASRRLAEHLLKGSLSELRKYSQSDIHYAVNASTSSMYSGVLTAISNLVTGAGLMFMILGTFFLLNPLAASVVAAYLLVMVVSIQFLIGGRLKKIGRDVNKGTVRATSTILDSVRSFREVSVLGKQDFFLQRFVDARRLLATTKANSVVLSSVPRLVIEQGLMLGVLAFVSWQVTSQDVSTGLASVGVFVIGSVRIIGAVIPVQNAYSSLKTTVVKAELAQRLHQEVQAKRNEQAQALGALESVEPSPEDVLFSASRAIRGLGIEVRDVAFTYPGSDRPAVQEINLFANPGGFVALVGPSGAGKTTLADLILGLNIPDAGRVSVEGCNPIEIRAKFPGLISYVPQKPGMVTGSIAENVALGCPHAEINYEWVWECLRLAALDKLIREIPDGIHASIGKHGDQLSGGQLQRLGLARALYSKPRLVILDEATSALDAGSEAAVSKNIRELGESVTLIVIAHRLSTIQHADCVYVVDEGKIIASGPFNTLRKTVPMIEEYVRLMSFDDTEG